MDENQSIQLNDIANELVIIHKGMIDTFLQTNNFSAILSLYIFYYYTAKWQKTNQPKCTTFYTAKGLKWDRKKVIKYKKELIKMGLIQEVIDLDAKTRKAKGWYIKVNYIFKKNTVKKIVTLSHSTDFHPTGNSHTNALSINILNALSTNKGDATKTETNDAIIKPSNPPKQPDPRYDYKSIVFPKQLDIPAFKNKLADYILYRQEIKKKITVRSVKQLINDCLSYPVDAAVEAINKAIASGWMGVHFDEKKKIVPRARPYSAPLPEKKYR